MRGFMASVSLLACIGISAVHAMGPALRLPRYSYHPVSVGDEWTVRHHRPNAKPQDTTYRVTDVAILNDGSILVTKSYRTIFKGGIFVPNDQEPKDVVMEGPSTRERVSFDGVYRVASYDVLEKKWVDQKPFMSVSSVLLPGQTWEQGNSTVKVTRKVGRVESVTVAAGKYQAIPMHTEIVRMGKGPILRTDWLVPGIGPVKIVEDGELWMELVSFTPAKKK